MASELKSDLRDTVDCGRKWLVDFDAGKTQTCVFDWSNNSAAIDMKMDGSHHEEKSFNKMMGLPFSSNWISAFTLSLLLELPPQENWSLDSFFEISFS